MQDKINVILTSTFSDVCLHVQVYTCTVYQKGNSNRSVHVAVVVYTHIDYLSYVVKIPCTIVNCQYRIKCLRILQMKNYILKYTYTIIPEIQDTLVCIHRPF